MRMQSLASHRKPFQIPFSHFLEFPKEGNVARIVATTPHPAPCRPDSAPSIVRALEKCHPMSGEIRRPTLETGLRGGVESYPGRRPGHKSGGPHAEAGIC